METSQIPKTFWYTLSISILASTVVLLYIALRSTNISIEIANTKIVLNRAISELEEQHEALIEAKEELQLNYDNYNEIVTTLKKNNTLPDTGLNQLTPLNSQLDNLKISQERFKINQEKLFELKKKIE